MWAWLRRFVMDEAFFVSSVRGLIAVGGALYASGIVPASPATQKLGLLVMALAHVIPAGQVNKTNGNGK